MVLKAVRDKADQAWTMTKKILVVMSCWGLVFSLVTIGRLRVGFDYDDTIVHSTPAFDRAFRSAHQPFSPGFWEIVNNGYDVERRKPLPYLLAWSFRILGFKISIITARPPYGGEALRKEWRYLTDDFVYSNGTANKHRHLLSGNYVLFFGDSDSDITESRKAKVFPLRVKRAPKSTYKEDYRPGSLGEIVLPLTQF